VHVRTIERLLVIASLSALLPTVTVAQGGRAVIPPRRPARAALKAERQAQRNDSAPPLGERALLQRQVRQAWIGNVRRQLNLNNEQMRTLNQVNAKYERQRGDIQRDERQARVGLKAAMEDTAAGDQNARIEQQMNVLVGAQRRRADLFENEQKELAGFLTPLQRARYSVLQERLAQRLQQLRQNQQEAPAGPPPPENPPER
jgi:Spy/CpxP family protein refolding chaperone